MPLTRRLGLVLVTCLVALSAPALAPASAATVPLLTGVRATHYAGYDRVVFDFYGGVPAKSTVSFVTGFREPGSGNAVPVAGRARLKVRFETARGHKLDGTVTAPARTAWTTPNVLTTVPVGDSGDVVTYGVGLAKRTKVLRVTTTSSKVVVDVEAAFPTVQRNVVFFAQGFGDELYPVSVRRSVPAGAQAHGLMDRLFAGGTEAEGSSVYFFDSDATGYTDLTVSSGEVARVRLVGGCSHAYDVRGIGDEIISTLRQLPDVSWVKVYDPSGRTQEPTGQVDSIPTCLEPVPNPGP